MKPFGVRVPAGLRLMLPLLSALAALSALLTIHAEYGGARPRVYLFKPLTVVLIIFVALQAKQATAPSYGTLVAAGLLCSLAGDVFLMLPRDRFVAGLLSFLSAHVFYAAAFVRGGLRPSAWAAVPLALYGATMLGLLWPHLGRLKAAVAVYVALILFMAWAALCRWLGAEAGGGLASAGGGALAAAGALLFVASDSALAWNRFRGEFKSAQAFVLATYFAAQWLIALST